MLRAVSSTFAALACTALATTALAQDEATSPSERPPMTLRSAIHLALKSAPDGRVADARVQRAEAEHDLAMSAYMPRIETSLRAGATSLQDTLLLQATQFSMSTRYAEGRGDIIINIYDFGKTSNYVKASNANEDAAAAGREAARASIRRHTAELYCVILYDDQVLQAKRSALRHRTKFVALAHGLVTQGVRPALDEARAKVALEAAKTDVIVAESRLATDRARLASVLGQEPDRLPPLANVALPSVKDDASAAARTAETRPDVASVSHEARAAERRVDAAWAGHLPRIGVDIGGSYRMTYRDFDDATVPRRELMGTASLTVPLFDASINAQVDIARADAAAARAREERVRRDAKLDARDASLSLRSARALKDRAKEFYNAADTVFQVVEARYQSGLATPIELIDAESSEVEARETLAGAELKLQLATLAVLVATGHSESLEGS
jgi:outer membrane protein TolC